MADSPVIEVENLSKRYVLGRGPATGTLRDAITEGARSAMSLFKGGRQSGGTKGEFWALKDVAFSIPRGQAVAIIGRNGAGKSTLLKILSRITEPTTGSIKIRGRIASLLEVGTGFHPELSGRENIFLNGAILGMSKMEIRRKFDEIVEFAEVARFIDTPVKHYSSGMYVRLAFSVAAHLEPEILIVDEVLAVGDVAFQKKCLGKMEDVSRTSGRTVLFVSHNMNAVRQLCQTSIMLSGGCVQMVGPTPKVLDVYLRDAASAAPAKVPPPPAELLDSVYVISAELLDADGRTNDIMPVGTPWSVRLTVRAVKPVDRFVIAVGFVSSDGTGVQTAWSPPADLPAGDHEIVFGQTVHFQAGGYSLIVGLSVKDVTVQQFEAARFDISSENAVGYFPMTAGVGLVLNSMQISTRKL